MGVASAALFPAILLSGDIGKAGESLHSLSGAGAKFWGGGAEVDAPLFRGGSLWFGRKAAVEAYNNAADSYRQTVLDSFTQVADVLKALEHDAEAVKAQSIIVASAEDVRDLVWANYNAGLVSAIEVLNAEIQVEQADINYTAAVAQRYQDTVALFAAIGGGWQNEDESARRRASRGAP